MIIESQFTPAWWLNNPHAQTIFPSLIGPRLMKVVNKHERIELPDGDFIDLAWATQGISPSAPLVVLLHGLGGDLHSVYATRFLHAFNQAGLRGVLMHFRGASHEANRLPRTYHAGDTADFDYLLNTLNAREPHTQKAAVGISLGGNVLLKWLGEAGTQSMIATSVAVSVPFQLSKVADRMNQGFSRIYQSYLLYRMRQVYHKKIKAMSFQLPHPQRRLSSIKNFWEFDEYLTAPLHGYDDVYTYYHEASSIQYLKHIKTPTLIIHAYDDPFMTPQVLPKENDLAPAITLELSQHGGHVGFVTGSLPGKPIYWLEERVPHFLNEVLL